MKYQRSLQNGNPPFNTYIKHQHVYDFKWPSIAVLVGIGVLAFFQLNAII